MIDPQKIDEALLQQAMDGLGVPNDHHSDTMDQLQQIGWDAILYRSRKAGQPWSATRDRLERLGKMVVNLLDHLGGTSDMERLKQAMDESPALAIVVFNFAELTNPDRKKHSPLEDEETCNRLTSFLRDLENFKTAADAGLENVSAKISSKRGGHRHEGDWARWETSWHVLRLYYELKDKRPGVSKTEGAPPTGPAVRFLDTCLRAYGWDTDPSTAANIIDKLKEDPTASWNIKSENQS